MLGNKQKTGGGEVWWNLLGRIHLGIGEVDRLLGKVAEGFMWSRIWPSRRSRQQVFLSCFLISISVLSLSLFYGYLLLVNINKFSINISIAEYCLCFLHCCWSVSAFQGGLLTYVLF